MQFLGIQMGTVCHSKLWGIHPFESNKKEEEKMTEDEFRRDLYLFMNYDVKEDVLTIEETNVKADYIDDLLTEWIRGQSGKGADNRTPNQKDKYQIQMEVDLSYDNFRVNSDTGNHGLTAGIIMTSIGKWKFSSKLEEKLKEEVKNE